MRVETRLAVSILCATFYEANASVSLCSTHVAKKQLRRKWTGPVRCSRVTTATFPRFGNMLPLPGRYAPLIEEM